MAGNEYCIADFHAYMGNAENDEDCKVNRGLPIMDVLGVQAVSTLKVRLSLIKDVNYKLSNLYLLKIFKDELNIRHAP